MTKVTIENLRDDSKLIPMADMKPCQVGIVRGGHYDGHVVMRTASSENFEFMDMSNFVIDCWDISSFWSVEIVEAEITIKIK
jgi:hypothetical protein